MNQMLKRLIIASGFLLIVSVALALPREEGESKKVSRSPAIDDDDFPTFPEDEQQQQQPQFSILNLISGQAGKLFNDFLQIPSALFKFFSGVIARQPFAKLREEVRNLNISYPK